MRYIKENNQGIIALIKRNENYEFNAIDSSYCVLEDYISEIKNGEFFVWIQETKLEYDLMRKDFNNVRNSGDKEIIEKYLLWERPNIYIDFDEKFLANYYPDRLFEQMVPKNWTATYVKTFEEFEKYIPVEFKYWK
ncbi:MAG: hypothetical protein R2787_11350 [Saprospiraceae bacterium]